MVGCIKRNKKYISACIYMHINFHATSPPPHPTPLTHTQQAGLYEKLSFHRKRSKSHNQVLRSFPKWPLCQISLHGSYGNNTIKDFKLMQSKLYDQGFPQGFSNRGGRDFDDYNRPIFREQYAIVFYCYFSNFTGGIRGNVFRI